ncbi:Hypothetical predicted protein [Pelobates cultripes]|uniref:Uncharacterized protein n=1 Tax=Pelobates cultripes TaxID=61616 RepID=A0AAD1R123_PELCU|nr:Hypothetical predicted protein [Pelobates cultripes]
MATAMPTTNSRLENYEQQPDNDLSIQRHDPRRAEPDLLVLLDNAIHLLDQAFQRSWRWLEAQMSVSQARHLGRERGDGGLGLLSARQPHNGGHVARRPEVAYIKRQGPHRHQQKKLEHGHSRQKSKHTSDGKHQGQMATHKGGLNTRHLQNYQQGTFILGLASLGRSPCSTRWDLDLLPTPAIAHQHKRGIIVLYDGQIIRSAC